jgi:DNA-binding transcriptional MerR regulator
VRFYEAKSLITSTREPNNYRDYSEAALGRVQQIRELLNAGLSTQDIARNRHAIADYLAELQKRAE